MHRLPGIAVGMEDKAERDALQVMSEEAKVSAAAVEEG